MEISPSTEIQTSVLPSSRPRLVIEGEIYQQDTIAEVVRKSTPASWERVFAEGKNELDVISQVLERKEKEEGKQWYPLRRDLFNAFHLTPLSQVRVVIVGQDPYHGTAMVSGVAVPQAMGLSFSVPRGVTIPPSLRNIYTEIQACYPETFRFPSHGDLTHWARQGVLLLNICLTVQPGRAGSHEEVWMPFMVRVLKAIVSANSQVIFVLWGKQAQKVVPHIGGAITLTSAHPSPFSAKNFFGEKHFLRINEHLQKLGQPPIDWNLP